MQTTEADLFELSRKVISPTIEPFLNVYNLIEINENEYLISLAVAGFDMDNLDILKEKNVLRIEGRKTTINDNSINYLHQGIAGRNFKKEFTLADNVEVENATLELGMLNIHLVREVPEADQPKKINISTSVVVLPLHDMRTYAGDNWV